jgi:hypothetical protein
VKKTIINGSPSFTWMFLLWCARLVTIFIA